MKFYDDEPLQCSWCGSIISPGNDYVEYDGGCFCDEECLKSQLLMNVDYTFEHLYSAEDRMKDYQDYIYESQLEQKIINEVEHGI